MRGAIPRIHRSGSLSRYAYACERSAEPLREMRAIKLRLHSCGTRVAEPFRERIVIEDAAHCIRCRRYIAGRDEETRHAVHNGLRHSPAPRADHRLSEHTCFEVHDAKS